ncbi:hypothetical protein [Thiothrix nivea]|uniref:hypothetical protein n=1 Tax=Thiothrix nivea TaxID=1031 RepID=UPI0012B69BFD|nr:hypothetical protein [Thiothrix nivea]
MSSTEDFIEKETRAVAKLREDVFEFQGFEREFLHFQEQMLRDYEKSSSLKHPVNKGDAREDYLKQFLSNNGLIAKKL